MEHLAIRYLNFLNTAPYTENVLLFIVLAVTGFAAVKTTAFELTIKRAPFFLAQSCLLVILSLTSLASYLMPGAIANGYLWLVIASYFAAYAASGYVWGIVAGARSLDGYGDKWHWFYSLIPLVNLALLFKPSQQAAEKSSFMSKIGAVAMVLLGFALYGAGRAIDSAVVSDAQSIVQSMQSDPAVTSRVLDAAVKSDGIEAVLKSSITEIRVPMEIDKITTLTSIEVVGRTLHYGYTLDGKLAPLADVNKAQIAKQFCGSEVLKPFIDAGATVRATYIDKNNYNLGEVSANTELCTEVK